MNSGDFVAAAVQLLLALVASGVLVKVLTVRQDRRKIAGDATASEANAASTLSGAALKMVESAQTTARDAEIRAKKAEGGAEECREEANHLWQELNRARWRIYHLEMREKALSATLTAAGIAVPVTPDWTDRTALGEPPPSAGKEDPL